MRNKFALNHINNLLPKILFITSYPPRECGIATYSQDLITALEKKFSNSFNIGICALESEDEKHDYTGKIEYILNVDKPGSFASLAKNINDDTDIRIVIIQHEFGFFEKFVMTIIDSASPEISCTFSLKDSLGCGRTV